MKSRRKAREIVLQALYQCDAQADWRSETVDLFFSTFYPELAEIEVGIEVENLAFARGLISGISAHLSFLDAQIQTASLRWAVHRMCRVDRNIIRIAAYEVAFLEEIPTKVSLNEAIEIAKRYGSDESPMFVNGVLDNLARSFEAHPEVIERELGRVAVPVRAVG